MNGLPEDRWAHNVLTPGELAWVRQELAKHVLPADGSPLRLVMSDRTQSYRDWPHGQRCKEGVEYWITTTMGRRADDGTPGIVVMVNNLVIDTLWHDQCKPKGKNH